jgi:hypothetical protein
MHQVQNQAQNLVFGFVMFVRSHPVWSRSRPCVPVEDHEAVFS